MDKKMLIFNIKINMKKNLKLNFWNINLFAMFYDNEKFRNLKKAQTDDIWQTNQKLLPNFD